MSPLEIDRLRGRLLYALDATRPTEHHPASLFLLVLGACWLAAPDVKSEERLEALYYDQAKHEAVESIDDVTSALILAGGVS